MAQFNNVGYHSKIILFCCCFIISAAAILAPPSADSAIQGDINNDGRIDTSEAIYALQVAAGLYPGITTSCLLSGKGDWSINTEYAKCDVVSSGGENYVCNTSHTSSNSAFGDDVANWDLLSLKGDKGDPGADGEKTTSFTELTDQAADAQIPAAITRDTELSAHTATSSAHHTKTTDASELSSGVLADGRIPATIARDSEITWGDLAGIPAGFGDGTDNDSGGDITGVTAGTGLTGGATTGNASLGLAVPMSISGTTTDHSTAVISGENTGNGYGVRGWSSTNYGVYGYSSAGAGVFGYSGDNSGVTGINGNIGNEGRLGTQDYGVYGSSANNNSYAGYFLGKTAINGGNFELSNPTGENWLSFLRGSNQNAGFAFMEEGASETQWIFPYFRGWQSDNLIIRDEAASPKRDVMTFEAGSGKIGIGTSQPAAVLDVAGQVKIADGNSICDSTRAGALRWTGYKFQGCDGKIWVTLSGDHYDASIPVVNVSGNEWMDRNLGASQVAISVMDSTAYGDLYQWGRLQDGHEQRTSTTTTILSNADVPVDGNFIIVSTDPYDWRNPQNHNLWQETSGINNPCPSGFRVPTQIEWENVRTSWSQNDAVGAYNSPLKLVVAGYRAGTTGAFFSVASSGMYWSSSIYDGNKARYLRFDSSSAEMKSIHRAFGMSIRCIKD